MSMFVTGPGGVSVEFPDGTDNATIDRVMREAMKTNAEGMGGPRTPDVGFGEDLLSTAKSSLAEGVLDIPGVVGNIDAFAHGVGTWAGNKLRDLAGKPPAPDAPRFLEGIAPTTGEIEKSIGFEPYEPAYDANKIIGEGLRFAPTAAVGGAVSPVVRALAGTGRASAIPGAIASSTMKYGVAPGMASEAAAQGVDALGLPGLAPYARLTGALLGPNLAALSRRVVTPRTIPPENAAAAAALRREGVDYLTEGDVTHRADLMARERAAMGTRAAGRATATAEDFTAAALRRAGINADRATPEVMADAFRRIGRQFDDLSAANQLVPDRAFATDLADAVQWYADRVAPPNRAPIIGRYLQEIGNVTNGAGAVPGRAYLSLRSRIAADARSTMDPYASRALNDLTAALDDAMERSVVANNPTMAGAFRAARDQYRAMLVLEKAASGAGSNAALGLITPSALRNATTTVYGKRAYVTGQGPFAELSRSGEAILRPLPETGFAPAVRPWTSMSAAVIPFAAAGRVAREIRMRPMMQRYLTNSVLGPPRLDPVAAALARSMTLPRLATPSTEPRIAE